MPLTKQQVAKVMRMSEVGHPPGVISDVTGVPRETVLNVLSSSVYAYSLPVKGDELQDAGGHF